MDITERRGTSWNNWRRWRLPCGPWRWVLFHTSYL